MRFVWFWTFWHWSKEGLREGSLLRDPLNGIGGHWDEWFRHEASEDDRRAVEETGRDIATQRQFITWLVRHWARDVGLRSNRLASRFVLGQLAQLPPFNQWLAFEKFRTSYGLNGVCAIVLSEKSGGEPEDIRAIEALVLPINAGNAAAAIIPEGFQTDPAELAAAHGAAASLLGGKALGAFLARWVVGGERPYPRWLKRALALAWLTTGALVTYLLFGPDPGTYLELVSVVLAGLWIVLLGTAVATAGVQVRNACREGRAWRARLAQSSVRLRMEGGLTLKGGSAGLAFCLNTLLALYRAHPRGVRRSWLWRTVFRQLHHGAPGWAATGVVAATGEIQPVVLEPKLRASLRHPAIRDVLAPRQADTRQRNIERLATRLTPPARTAAHGAAVAPGVRLGFAAEPRHIRAHACGTVAQAVMAVGDLASPRQITLNLVALAITGVMVLALPDLGNILHPPPAPKVVAPSSPSPYHLWVSLDTNRPEAFQVVMESGFWANRHALVTRHTGPHASTRAEIRLRRVGRQTVRSEDDGRIWLERRRSFLFREFAPGERVGLYSFSYVSRIGQ